MRATLSLTTVISLVRWLAVPTAVVYRSAWDKLRFLTAQASILAAPAARVTDVFVGEISGEVIDLLLSLGRKSAFYKDTAEKLGGTLQELAQIFKEIAYSGNELPPNRQKQLNQVTDDITNAKELCLKLMRSSRWNAYENVRDMNKLEKIEKKITRFIKTVMQLHMAADISHTRFGVSEMGVRVEQLDGSVRRLESEITQMKIGNGGWVEEAMKQKEMESELWQSSSGPIVAVAQEMGKTKVREMLIGRDDPIVTIRGIGGSGKTTLAAETCKDPQVRDYFKSRILFLTVSQSPNLGNLKAKLWGFINGTDSFSTFNPIPAWNLDHKWVSAYTLQKLIVLDDVWSLSDLEPLLALTRAPGCKTLVVSRNHFETVSPVSYEMELLRDHEAMALFCLHAFDQKSVPPTFDDKLVMQIVNECKGLPLALKVVGAALRDQPEMCWLNAKNRLSRGEPISEYHGMRLMESMKMSTDHLNKKVRECFLDLGAFPEDQRIPLDVIINMWVELHDLAQDEAFAILVELSNKNLVSLVKDARSGDIYSSYYDVYVTQHDVLRDLATYLNSREDINARSRLIMPKRESEIPREWQRNSDQPFNARIVSIHTDEMQEMDWPQMDFPKAEVLILNFEANNYLLPPFIESMPALRALIIINHSSSTAVLGNDSVFGHLPNLRTLWLEKVAVPNLSNTTTPYKRMRKLSFILCKINTLDPSATDLPSIFPNLVDLTIDHCDDLLELPPSICSMRSLQSLSVTNCHSLKKLPPNMDGLANLEVLRTYACPNLKTLPSGVCKLGCLKYLDISQCVNLVKLPEGVGELVRLEKIDMRECSRLSRLPKSVLGLRSLRWVICDDEVSYVWRDVVRARPSVHLQLVEKCFTLDWLN